MPTGVYPRTEAHLARLRSVAKPFQKGHKFGNRFQKGHHPVTELKKGHQIGLNTRFQKGNTIGHRFQKGHKPSHGFQKGNTIGLRGNFKHGLYPHHLYHGWHTMMQRCYNPKAHGYKDYGGKGIEVWEPWHNVRNFIFGIMSLLGDRPVGYSMDRVNPHEGYNEWNVRWSDKKTQTENTRKNTTNFYIQCGEH
jgi:hypothetical protein